jgi:flagellar biosynthesis regulator FlbT
MKSYIDTEGDVIYHIPQRVIEAAIGQLRQREAIDLIRGIYEYEAKHPMSEDAILNTYHRMNRAAARND